MDEKEDPESYFDPIKEALAVVADITGDKYKKVIEEAELQLDETIQEILEEQNKQHEPDWDDEYYGGGSKALDFETRERDIFDDVDR